LADVARIPASERAKTGYLLMNGTMNQQKIAQSHLNWLDMLRVLCALQIAGIHWLRACMHADLFANTSLPENFRNFIWSYQNNNMGFRMLQNFPNYLMLDNQNDLAANLTNNIGYLFGFGWEALNVFILISGFSLTLKLTDWPKSPMNFWLPWYKKRFQRILFPFYTIVIIVISSFLVFYPVINLLHIPFFESIQSQLQVRLNQDWLHLLLSNFLLIDPWKPNWGATFFIPSWWFVPSILTVYLAFPLYFWLLNRFGSPFLLFFSFIITVTSYWQGGHNILPDNPVFFIVTRELFNFSLGMALARFYQNRRPEIEKTLFSPPCWVIGIFLFILGNFMNWFPLLYPFSSIFFTLGLTIVGANLSSWLLKVDYVKKLRNVDSYIFYLIHQPFSYLVAIALSYPFHRYTTFFGIFIYLFIVLLFTSVFSKKYTAIERKLAMIVVQKKL
jgi:peptidoglycan/LPS O-acetylase OafA/YrhL